MAITIGDAILYIRGDSSKLGGDLRGAESQTKSFFGNLGQGIQQGFGMAIGSAVMRGVGVAIGGLINLGRTALDQVASFEKLSLSMESLIAREISMGSTVESTSTTMRQATVDELLARERLAAQIASQQATLANLNKTQGENALETRKAAQDLAALENRYKALGFTEGDLIAVTTTNTERTISMSDALAQAGPRAQELLNWIQQLAIKSPFDMEGVAMALKTAMAYGFTSEQAQELTQNLIDFAAATGGTTDTMNSIALALGQIQAKGKLAGQEILQLVNAGVPVNSILESMGYTLDDVSAGLVSADEFLAAFNATMESDFGGAAERQSQSWSGLLNTLGDIKNIALREFFGGIFEAAQPVVALFADWLQGPGLATIQNWGDALGNFAENGIGKLTGAFILFKETGDLGATLTALFGSEKAEEIMNFLVQFQPLVDALVNFFSAFVESGPAADVAWSSFLENAAATVSANLPQIVANISGALNSMAEWWRQHGSQVIAIVTGTINVVTAIFGGGFTLLSGLVGGSLQILSGNVEGGLTTLVGSVQTFTDNILSLLGTNSDEVAASWEGTIELMLIAWVTWSDQMVLAVSTFMLDLIAGIQEHLGEFETMGSNLVEGLQNGIESSWQAVVDFITGGIQAIIDAVKKMLGIQSPSLVFEGIGENIGKGLANGIDNAEPLVSEAMGEMMDNIMSLARGFSGLGNFAANRLRQTLIDPLQEQVDALDEQIAVYEGRDDFYSVVERNRLMAQRAELTGQIAEHEQKILEMQEKQSQLDFLNKQFDLLKLISENGLNADDILGGLELGINANLEDIIEAMTKALTELVENAEDTLGIASPSKVFQGMGAQIMAGLASGLTKGLALPVQIMDSLVPALSAPLGANRQYNFSQTINNFFPSDRSGQGFGTLRALSGA